MEEGIREGGRKVEREGARHMYRCPVGTCTCRNATRKEPAGGRRREGKDWDSQRGRHGRS